MLDIHAHILPEVDDGARSRRQSLLMLKKACEAGIDTLVATPHILRGKKNLSSISDAYLWLKPHAQEVGIQLLMGFEVSYQALLDLPCSQLKGFCISGTNLMLLELDKAHLLPQWSQVLSNIVKEGIIPVIAHPERYEYIQQHPELVGKIRMYGCKFQIDAQAFLKPPWNLERRTAEKILRSEWMDFVASDAHQPQDYDKMKTVIKRLRKCLPVDCISSGSIHNLNSMYHTDAASGRPVRFV